MPKENAKNEVPVDETVKVAIDDTQDTTIAVNEEAAAEATVPDPDPVQESPEAITIEESGDGALPDVTAEVASEQSSEMIVEYKTGTKRLPVVGDVVAYGFWRGRVIEVTGTTTVKITGLPSGACGKTFLFSYYGAVEFLGHAV